MPLVGNRARARAFSLVEVVVALGIASFCLIPLMGLLLAGLQGNQGTIEQTAAAGIARDVVADLKATPSGTAVSPRFKIAIPAAASSTPTTVYIEADGSAAAAADAASRYRVSLGFAPPAGPQRTATLVRVLVSWPGQADTGASWPSHALGSVETVAGIDRN